MDKVSQVQSLSSQVVAASTHHTHPSAELLFTVEGSLQSGICGHNQQALHSDTTNRRSISLCFQRISCTSYTMRILRRLHSLYLPLEVPVLGLCQFLALSLTPPLMTMSWLWPSRLMLPPFKL
ncbi:hypothetical protein AAZX31_20G107600 [Glycine max]